MNSHTPGIAAAVIPFTLLLACGVEAAAPAQSPAVPVTEQSAPSRHPCRMSPDAIDSWIASGAVLPACIRRQQADHGYPAPTGP